MAVLGQDTVQRSDNSSAWGQATDTQNWSSADGGSATLSVSSDKLQITASTSGTYAHLGNSTAKDAHALVRFSLSHTTDNAFIFLRGTSSNTHYRFRTNGGGSIAKDVNGTVSALTLTFSNPITLSANTLYWMRAKIVTTNSSTPSSTLYLNIWPDGQPETAGSVAEVDGDTSITGAGTFGLGGSLNNAANSISFDYFYVVDYRLADELSVSESPLYTGDTTPGFVEALSASDQINVYPCPVDALSADDSASFFQVEFALTDAIPLDDSASSYIDDTTPGFVEALVADDSVRTSYPIFTESLTANDSATVATDITVGLIDLLYATDTYSITTTPARILGQDTFVRPDQTGLGFATDGQLWANPGASYNYSITSSEGQAIGAPSVGYALLGTSTPSDIELLARISVSSKADSFGLVFRYNSSINNYRARANNGTFTLQKNVSGTVTALTGTLSSAWPPGSISFTLTAGQFYWIRIRAIGTGAAGTTANLWAKVWPDGQPEPPSWSIAASDATFTNGRFGLLINTGVSTDVMQFDHVYAVDYLNDDWQLTSSSLLDTGDTTPGFVESLSASDPALEQKTYLPNELLSVTETLLDQETFIPLDGLTGTETMLNTSAWNPLSLSGGIVDILLSTDIAFSLEANTVTESTLLADNTVSGFVESLSASEVLSIQESFAPNELLSAVDILLSLDGFAVSDNLSAADFLSGSVTLPYDLLSVVESSISEDGYQPNEALSISDSALPAQVFVPVEGNGASESIFYTPTPVLVESLPTTEILLNASLFGVIESLSISSVMTNTTANLSSAIESLSVAENITLTSVAIPVESLSAVETILIEDGVHASELLSGIDGTLWIGSNATVEALSASEQIMDIDSLLALESLSGASTLSETDGYLCSETLPITESQFITNNAVWSDLLTSTEQISIGGTYQPLEAGMVLESLLGTNTCAVIETTPISESAVIISSASTLLMTFIDVLPVAESPFFAETVMNTESLSSSSQITATLTVPPVTLSFDMIWITRSGKVTWRTR